jgi:CRP/FNR family transcriptional regulator, cyclic AMP receptor protein
LSKATQQQDVLILSSSTSGLASLKPNDWALIADKATRCKFERGERIVNQGSPSNGLYLLLKGSATVQVVPPVPALLVLPGDVCGEISFLDGQPGTADVVANEAVEAYFIDRPTLHSLFELFPHLGSRFYQSLAAILARRLREVIGRNAPAKKDTQKKDTQKDRSQQ